MRARHGVGHGVESQTWPFRSAPCLSIRQVRHCAIVRSARLTSRNCMRDARKHVDMWTTQARCPQTHRLKNNKSKRQFDCFGSAAVRPRYVTSPTVSPDSRDTSTLHCAIFTRIQTAIHIAEGHYPWDLESEPNMMTNANIAKVEEAGADRVLKLDYKGGEQTIALPANVTVVGFDKAGPDQLVAGRKVFV